MNNEKLTLDLKPVLGVKSEDWYLTLIDVLVKELSQFKEVELLNDYIVTDSQRRAKEEFYKSLTEMYLDLANKEKLFLDEFFRKYPEILKGMHDGNEYKEYLKGLFGKYLNLD